MKKVLFFILILFSFLIVSCGENNTPDDPIKEETVEEVILNSKSEYETFYQESVKDLTVEEKNVFDIKYNEIMLKVDSLKGSIEEVKSELAKYKEELNSTLELVKKEVNSFIELKNQALQQIDMIYNSIKAVANTVSMEYITSVYNDYKEKVNSIVESKKDELKQLPETFAAGVKKYVTKVADEALVTAITEARKQLKTIFEQAIATISNNDIKAKVQETYEKYDLLLASVINSETAQTVFQDYMYQFSNEIKTIVSDLGFKTLEEYKNYALTLLNNYYQIYTKSIDISYIKAAVEVYYNNIKTIINNFKTKEEAQAYIINSLTNYEQFISGDLLKLAINEALSEVETILNEKKNLIKDQTVVNQITNLYNTYKGKIVNQADSLTKLVEIVNQEKDNFIKDLTTIVQNYIKNNATKIKSQAIEYIDGEVSKAVAKITDNDIKKEVTDLQTKVKGEVNALKNVETFEQDILTIKNELVEGIKTILAKVTAKELEKAKNAAIEYIDGEVSKVVDLITDTDIKKELTDLQAKVKKEVQALSNIDTVEQDIEKIKNELVEGIKTISKKFIDKYVEVAKKEVETLYNSVYAKVSETSQTLLSALYNSYLDAMSKINSLETFEDDITKAADAFKESLKTYITEAIQGYKTAAIATIKAKYDELIANVELSDYVTSFNKLYDDAVALINNINELAKAITDTVSITTDFIDDAIEMYAEYWKAFAVYIKEKTLEDGKAIYDGVTERTEYKELKALKKIAASAEIELAYTAFKTALNNLPTDIGVKKVCQEALTAFSNAVDKALGIEVTE